MLNGNSTAKEIGESVNADLVNYRKTKQALKDHASLVVYNTISFLHNCPVSFIEQCWSDDEHLRDHFQTIWISLNKKRALQVSDTDLLIHFFAKLDSVNRTKFCNYILRWQEAQK